MCSNVVCIVATLESDHGPVGRHLKRQAHLCNPFILSVKKLHHSFHWLEITLDHDDTFSKMTMVILIISGEASFHFHSRLYTSPPSPYTRLRLPEKAKVKAIPVNFEKP